MLAPVPSPPAITARASAFLAALLLFASGGAVAAGDPHTVRRGDTLGGIAQRYGCTISEIKKANRIRGTMIRIGQKLEIPDSCGKKPGGGSATSTPAIDPGDLVTHVVVPGDTLSGIAERYGVTVQHLKDMNKSIGRRGIIRVGQKLRLKANKAAPRRTLVRYTIEAGDTLSAIAKKYGVSVKDIEAMNPKKRADALRIGDRISLWIEGPEKRSASIGRPQHGELVDGEQLPDGQGWYRRRPDREWGTNETIRALTAAFRQVRKKHPKAHDIAVGDISAKKGGHLAPHKSHQTGRDVDIGLYFEGQPKEGPKAFLSGLKHRIDYEATWTLILTLAGDSPGKGQAEYMFLDYGVQRKIYDWAKKEKKVSPKLLEWLFQYPRGNRAMRGIIRHEPGHVNHIHVRFQCPRGDDHCL